MNSNKRESKKRKQQAHEQLKKSTEQYWSSFSNFNEGIPRLKSEQPQFVRLALQDASDYAIHKLATGTPFPDEYRAISSTIATNFSGNLATELVWTCEILGRFSTQINDFTKLKQEFDRALLLQEYEKAQGKLDEIRGKFGCSLWLANAELVLAEHKGGLKANRELLQSILIDSHPAIVQAFVSYFSQRAEKNLSNANYRKKIGALIRHHTKDASENPLAAAGRYHFEFALDFSGVGGYRNHDLNLAYVLHRESLLPIIDRYANFVRVLCVLQAATWPAIEDTVRTCIMRSAEWFVDSRFTMLRHLNASTSSVNPTEVGDALMLSLDAYTSGRYLAAQGTLSQALALHPDCFEFFELYAASALHLRQEPANPFPPQSIASEILAATFDVLAKNDKTSDALELLKKFGSSLDGMRLADQLIAFALKHENPRHQLNPGVLAAINASAPSAKVSQQFGQQSDALKYLRQISKRYPQNASVRLFEAVHRNPLPTEDLDGVPKLRWQSYQAYALRRTQDFVRASALYRNLLESHATTSPSREDAFIGLLESLIQLDELRECAQLVVDMYLEQKALLTSVSLEELVSRGLKQNASAKWIAQDICWPLACYIHYNSKDDPRKNESLYYACEDFLHSAGVDRPSGLSTHEKSFDKRELVLFLRHVCVPEILDFSISFSNSSELEDERIAICQWLLSIDPKNAEVYSQEISQLTQAGMIRHAVLRLDKSKVHIDTKGIARSLDKSFKERFDRYVAYSRLNDQLRKSLELKGFSFGEGQEVVVVSDDGLTQFHELFEELKNRFISSNEYGLDSYLSVRIRHGTLSGQIRSQFERENLITRRSGAEGVYAKNTYWHWLFSRYGDDVDASADKCLRDFSQKIDAIIEKVKSKWIQIKSPANQGEGLFDFDYSMTQVADLYVKVLTVEEHDGFVQAIFSELWNQTTANLAIVVDRIRGELRELLTAALESMAENIFALHPDIRHSPFGDAVTRCRTSIQNEIETIAAWFHAVSEKTAPDFRFALLVETATAVVRRCFPTFNFSLSLVGSADFQLKGERFASFVDVLFILFENIVRHSRIDSTSTRDLRPQLAVAVDCRRLLLEVSNSLGTAVELPSLQERVSDLNKIKASTSSPKSIRTEGGSGYYKLHKLIRHDLGRGDDYSIIVQLVDGVRFAVKIEMGLEDLLHEDPGDRR